MKKILMLFFLIIPVNIYAENTSLDAAVYEVMRIGFMLPPADLKWNDTSANSNYTDIKAKVRKQLQDALMLNKKYPDIPNNQKNNLLFRQKHLTLELEDNINNNKLNPVEIKLYRLFLNISLLSVNEYNNKISNIVDFNESDFYIALRSRILISYILYNINYMPEEQKIILEYTKMYLEKYKPYLQNDFKFKIVKYDYYTAYKNALDNLTKAVNERYNLTETINLNNIKDSKGSALKGLWSSIEFDKAGNPLITTYYSLLFGGYTGYHYYNFSAYQNFIETFYISNNKRINLILYPKSAYVKNDIIYASLSDDPINYKLPLNKPLYIQARFKDKSLIEFTDSYYDGVTLYVDNINKYITDYSLTLIKDSKISMDNLKANFKNFIYKYDKKADVLYAGKFIINNKPFHILISYHNYAYGYNGINNKWKNMVITFWEDMGNYALLKDYIYLDNGGIFEKCSSQNNMVLCSILYNDTKNIFGKNEYTYILDNNSFYLYSYKNTTGIDDKDVSCTYYLYNSKEKISMDKLSLNFYKNLRDKVYSSKKCGKIIGIE